MKFLDDLYTNYYQFWYELSRKIGYNSCTFPAINIANKIACFVGYKQNFIVASKTFRGNTKFSSRTSGFFSPKNTLYKIQRKIQNSDSVQKWRIWKIFFFLVLLTFYTHKLSFPEAFYPMMCWTRAYNNKNNDYLIDSRIINDFWLKKFWFSELLFIEVNIFFKWCKFFILPNFFIIF